MTEELIQSIAREVEVTRRLFRSGESEYLIDGQTCRLRDVHDLLMDTGLGAKAYAIIEQGKIGMILSSRPTDRRQLIEEAAGVTKYKARRRAAELKLDAARQNLLRVDDIVFEVDKQRGTLKRQAAKARRYQKLRDELRRWEKVLFARKYRQLAETIESARGRLADARERESVASARVAQVENDLGRLRIEMAEAETRATNAREAAHARELAINRQQQQIVFDREQVASLDERGASMASELATIEARREPSRPGAGRPLRGGARSRGRARAGRDPARRGIGRLRHGASRDRGARVRRRGGEERRVLGDQLGDGAPPRAGDCRGGAGSGRRDAAQTGRRSRRCADRVDRGPKLNGRRRPTAFAARTTRSRRRASPVWRASRSWPARVSSTSGARARCGPRNRRSPGSRRA